MSARDGLPDEVRDGLPDEVRDGLFSLRDAADAGVARTRLRGSTIAHPFRGVYGFVSFTSSTADRAAGLARVLPAEARFSHLTAAELYGAPLRMAQELHVSVPDRRSAPRRRDGVVTHQRVRADDVPRLVRGVALTSPEQTFVDLAAVLGLDDLVVLGDFLLRHWTTPDELHDHVARSPRATRGVVRAREALALVREGVDSPQETRLRLIVVRDGLPEPVVNPVVRDAGGGWLGQPDLAHVREQVATQMDGDVHRTSQRRWRQDIARDEAFRDNGWVVLRTTGADVRHPGPYLARLRRALRRPAA